MPDPVASKPEVATDDKLPVQPVAPQAPEATPEPVAELSPRAKMLAELGFTDVKDDDEAFERVVSAYKQTREIKSHVDQVLGELKQQQVKPEFEPAQQVDGGWWNPPQVDLNLAQQYRTADGWKPDAPPDVRRQYDAYQAYVNQWAEKLVKNPDQALKPILEAEFNRLFEEKYGQVSATQKEAELRDRTFAENQWLFEVDPVTKRPATSHDGLPVLSAEGKLLDAYFREAEQMGVQGFSNQWKYALTLHKANKAATQSTQTTTTTDAQKTAEEKRRELLAAGAPNRAGSVPTAGTNPPANRNLTPGQRFVQNAQRNGVALT